MATYRIPRMMDVDLQFEGERIADVSSRYDGAPRWNEIRIYHTSSGKYVVEDLGRTSVPSEGDKPRAYVCETPADVVEALRKGPNRFGEMYLTNTALDALAEAEARDDAFQNVTVEEV